MRLAVSTYSMWRWMDERGRTLEQALEWIKAAGVDGVEFVGVGAKEGQDALALAKRLRERCADLGLAVAGYCTGAEFLVADGEQRKAVEAVKREVDVAAALGATNMRHDVTRGPEDAQATTIDEVVRRVAPAVREVTEHAATLGVRTSVENHGFYLQTAERVERLVDGVGHPNFAVTLDLGNFLCLDQDPVAAAERLASRAIMVHAKDFHVRPKADLPLPGWFATPTAIALRGAIVGHGAIDLKRSLAALQKAGYRGFLSLEFEGIEDPENSIRMGLDWLRARIGAAASAK